MIETHSGPCWGCGAHGPTAGARDLDAAKAAAVAKWDDRP